MTEKKFTIEEANTYFAKELNMHTWRLLTKADRSIEENEQMIDAAHGSRYHWRFVGEKFNDQRAEWLISRVYSVLNMPRQALFYAKRCKEITENYTNEIKDFDLAYTDEAMARAHACNGNFEECKRYYKSAQEKGKWIADKEDKEYFTGDLNSEPWYGAINK
ncbi:MAG TPA: hypothetical protein VGK25_04145 [Ignavibacteria bacterium]|jgi:tetratricopeptide (TPR) repeat protein